MNSNRLNGLKESLSAFWMERNARERHALTLASAVIVLALLYLIFISPALDGRAQLQKNLPALRQQAAELQVLAKQASTVATVNAPPAPVLTKESIETALARQGLKPQSVVNTGELTKVQLSSSSFSGLVNWLDEMQKTARLSLVEANIEALAPVDTVNASLTLRQQRSQSRDE
jgi:general secretion pathway protein M